MNFEETGAARLISHGRALVDSEPPTHSLEGCCSIQLELRALNDLWHFRFVNASLVTIW